MRQSKEVFCNGLGRTMFYILTFLALLIPKLGLAANFPVLKIEQATLFELSGSEATRIIKLPLLEARSPRVFKKFRLETTFNLPGNLPNSNNDDLLTVYCISLHDGGRISVNGTPVGEIATATSQTTVRNIRPYVFNIPRSLLKSGDNQLSLEWGARESLTISSIFIGPQSLVMENYQKRLFWQNTMAQITFTYALIIALVLLGIFAIFLNQAGYLLLGLSALGCAISVFVYLLPPMPAALYPYWRAIHMVGIAIFTNGAWLFLLKVGGSKNRWYPRLCIAWATLGPAVFLINFWINDVSFMRIPEGVWAITTMLGGVYPLLLLIASIRRRWDWRNLVFLTTTGGSIVLGVGDIVFQSTGASVFGKFGYSIQVISPIWLTSLALVLMTDFVKTLAKSDVHSKTLTESLENQQKQLSFFHDENQRIEKERAILEERQRVLADIQDGLGSQLITSLARSERGALSNEQTSQLLHECIDDLRLAIDAMSEQDNPFIVAAGNLRFRLEPRLRAAGIALIWNVRDLSDSLALPERTTLPLLRILQQSIINALNRLNATQIIVTLSEDLNEFVMQVHDNGQALENNVQREDSGVADMHKRAHFINAQISIFSDNGTTIHLRLNLET